MSRIVLAVVYVVGGVVQLVVWGFAGEWALGIVAAITTIGLAAGVCLWATRRWNGQVVGRSSGMSPGR